MKAELADYRWPNEVRENLASDIVKDRRGQTWAAQGDNGTGPVGIGSHASDAMTSDTSSSWLECSAGDLWKLTEISLTHWRTSRRVMTFRESLRKVFARASSVASCLLRKLLSCWRKSIALRRSSSTWGAVENGCARVCRKDCGLPRVDHPREGGREGIASHLNRSASST